MESSPVSAGRTGPLVATACVVILLAASKAAAAILGPVLLSLLLALTVRPLVEWLGRLRIGRVLTLLICLVALVIVGFGVISLVGVSIGRLHEALPVYETRLAGLLDGLQTRLAARGIDISGLVSGNGMSAARIAALAQKLLGGLSSLVSGAFLILFLVILFVAEMPLLNKMFGEGQSSHWTELSAGIRKYIGLTGLLGLVNALLNLVLLLVIGVDFPVLWAVLCFFFNFVPAVGNLLSLLPPALLALLEFGWQRALIVVVGYLVTNMAMDLVVKPRFFKTSLDISPLVVILSLIAWGWLLGPAGPILAVPLTMVVQRILLAARGEPAR